MTAAYALSMPDATKVAIAGDDAAALDWFPLSSLPPLAFDHAEILRVAFGEK